MLIVVVFLSASGYVAGRVHGQVGYREGYRSGYRQGYADGTRARPPRLGEGVSPEREVDVSASADHDPSETRQFRPKQRSAFHRVRHGRG